MMVLCCKAPIVLVPQNCLGNAHSLYTVRHKLSITQTLFQRRFLFTKFSEEQPVCNILLP